MFVPLPWNFYYISNVIDCTNVANQNGRTHCQISPVKTGVVRLWLLLCLGFINPIKLTF